MLNVACSRDRKCRDIEELVKGIVIDVLIKVNPACRAVYPPF
jgi:hypothetical protein